MKAQKVFMGFMMIFFKQGSSPSVVKNSQGVPL